VQVSAGVRFRIFNDVNQIDEPPALWAIDMNAPHSSGHGSRSPRLSRRCRRRQRD
jgi:hypothetical protein